MDYGDLLMQIDITGNSISEEIGNLGILFKRTLSFSYFILSFSYFYSIVYVVNNIF